jgi:hypothetical protein
MIGVLQVYRKEETITHLNIMYMKNFPQFLVTVSLLQLANTWKSYPKIGAKASEITERIKASMRLNPECF